MLRHILLVNNWPSGGAPLLPYSIDFTAEADGSLPAGWTGTTWAIATGAAKNTPAAGAELVTNGNMETGSPPSNWTAGGGAVLSSVADERTGGAGTQSLNINNSIAAAGKATQDIVAAVGDWLVMSGWQRRVDSNSQFRLSNIHPSLTVGNTTTTWLSRKISGRVTLSPVTVGLENSQGTINRNSRHDDISLKKITLSTLFASRDAGQADVICSGDWSLQTSNATQAGLIARLDNTTTPQNFIFAYHDGINVHLTKCVGGAYTSLIDAAAAYVASARMQIRTSGNNIELWYNSVQIGATQTVSDAGIIDNTLFGLFSTDVLNTCSFFSVVAN